MDDKISALESELSAKTNQLGEMEKKFKLIEFKSKKQLQELQVQIETEKTKADQQLQELKELNLQYEQKLRSPILPMKISNWLTNSIKKKKKQTNAKFFHQGNHSLLNLGKTCNSQITQKYMKMRNQVIRRKSYFKKKQISPKNHIFIFRMQHSAVELLEEKQLLLQQALSENMHLQDLIRELKENSDDKKQNEELIARIKELSDQNYSLQVEFKESIASLESTCKEDYLMKIHNLETNFNDSRTEKLQEELQNVEQILRKREEEIFDLQSQIKLLDQQNSLNSKKGEQEMKDLENQINQKAEKVTGDLKAVALQQNQKQKDQIILLEKQSESLQNQLSKAENDKKKFQESNEKLKAEILKLEDKLLEKNQQIEQLIDQYSNQFQDLSKQLNLQKRNHEQEMSTIKVQHEIQLKKLDQHEDQPFETTRRATGTTGTNITKGAESINEYVMDFSTEKLLEEQLSLLKQQNAQQKQCYYDQLKQKYEEHEEQCMNYIEQLSSTRKTFDKEMKIQSEMIKIMILNKQLFERNQIIQTYEEKLFQLIKKIEKSAKDQKYAEDIAQNNSLKLALLQTEKDQHFLKFKKISKELQAYQKQFGNLAKK